MNHSFESIVYKIAPRDSWDAGLPGGRYDGSLDDLRDGFIHLSTAAQVRATAEKYFAGQEGLIIAAIDVARLGASLKWEASRGGDMFPHVYGAIESSMVIWTKPLAIAGDGTFDFPAEIA
jgi:uncharacterized protein (DUF952 family)